MKQQKPYTWKSIRHQQQQLLPEHHLLLVFSMECLMLPTDQNHATTWTIDSLHDHLYSLQLTSSTVGTQLTR